MSKKKNVSRGARKKRAVDALVEQLRADGQEVSEGAFTLDRDVARKKMREFQLADPWSFPLELLQAAVIKGAGRIVIRSDHRRLEMLFDGEPFSLEDFRELYGAPFSSQTDPQMRARRQLAMGVNAAQGIGVDRIRIVSGGRGQVQVLEMGKDGEERFETLDEAVEGTRIEVVYRGRWEHGLERRAGADRALALLRDRGCYTRAEVRVNDAPLPDGWMLPEAIVSLPLEGQGFAGRCGCVPRVETAQVRFVVDGVCIESADAGELPKSIVAVAEHPELRKDLTHGAVRRDGAYRVIMAAVGPVAEQVTEQLGYHRVEVGWFTPARNAALVVGGGDHPKAPAFPGLYVSRGYTGGARLFSGLKKILRLVVLALYFSPVLIVAKIVLFALGVPAGDWITVAFVGLVVLLFLLLGLLFIGHVFVGPRSKRHEHLRLALSGLRPRHALNVLGLRRLKISSKEALRQSISSGRFRHPMRVVGRVLALGSDQARDPAVLRDVWYQHADGVARLTASRAFLLEWDGPPVVVDPGCGPLFVETYRPGAVGPGLAPTLREQVDTWLGARGGKSCLDRLLADGRGAVLVPGDRVEIIAPHGAEEVGSLSKMMMAGTLGSFTATEGATEGAAKGRGPSRTNPGLLLTDTLDKPLIIRRLPASRDPREDR